MKETEGFFHKVPTGYVSEQIVKELKGFIYKVPNVVPAELLGGYFLKVPNPALGGFFGGYFLKIPNTVPGGYLGGQIVPEPTMNPPCTQWVNRGSPPVSAGGAVGSMERKP